jgi:hypothetical protein
MSLLRRFRTLRRRGKVLIILAALLVAGGAFAYAWLFADLPSIDRLQAGWHCPPRASMTAAGGCSTKSSPTAKLAA